MEPGEIIRERMSDQQQQTADRGRHTADGQSTHGHESLASLGIPGSVKIAKSRNAKLGTRDFNQGCENAGGTKPGEKPSAAGKFAAVGLAPLRTQLSIAATAVNTWGPVKAQWPLPVV